MLSIFLQIPLLPHGHPIRTFDSQVVGLSFSDREDMKEELKKEAKDLSDLLKLNQTKQLTIEFYNKMWTLEQRIAAINFLAAKFSDARVARLQRDQARCGHNFIGLTRQMRSFRTTTTTTTTTVEGFVGEEFGVAGGGGPVGDNFDGDSTQSELDRLGPNFDFDAFLA
jgi:hypothetical protein